MNAASKGQSNKGGNVKPFKGASAGKHNDVKPFKGKTNGPKVVDGTNKSQLDNIKQIASGKE